MRSEYKRDPFYLIYTVTLAVMYAASFGAVIYAINPIQALLFPQLTQFASLLFLPHGLRVLATIALGARAIPGLFLGAIYSAYFLWGINDPGLLVLFSLISSCSAFLALECLKALGIDAFYTSKKKGLPLFENVILAGVASSLTNSFLMTTVLESSGHVQNVTFTMAAYAIGDIVGLVVSWKIASLVMNYLRAR